MTSIEPSRDVGEWIWKSKLRGGSFTERYISFIEYFSGKDAMRAARYLDRKFLGGKPVRVIEHEARVQLYFCN